MHYIFVNGDIRSCIAGSMTEIVCDGQSFETIEVEFAGFIKYFKREKDKGKAYVLLVKVAVYCSSWEKRDNPTRYRVQTPKVIGNEINSYKQESDQMAIQSLTGPW